MRGRTDDVLLGRYWFPDMLKYEYVVLRFTAQDAYERAASLRIAPALDIVTRMFMLFRGVAVGDLGLWEPGLLTGRCRVWTHKTVREQRASQKTPSFPDGESVLIPLSSFSALTHNLTLSRTAGEVVLLDHKLHDVYPSVLQPALPIDSSATLSLSTRSYASHFADGDLLCIQRYFLYALTLPTRHTHRRHGPFDGRRHRNVNSYPPQTSLPSSPC